MSSTNSIVGSLAVEGNHNNLSGVMTLNDVTYKQSRGIFPKSFLGFYTASGTGATYNAFLVPLSTQYTVLQSVTNATSIDGDGFISPDGRFLCVGPNTTLVYKLDGYGINGMEYVAHVQAGAQYHYGSFSYDGTYMAHCLLGSPYGVRIQQYNGTSYSEIQRITYGTSQTRLASISPDGMYMLTSTATSTGYFYKRTNANGTFALVTTYGSLYAGSGGWSPDGNYIALGLQALTGGTRFTIYKRDGDSLVQSTLINNSASNIIYGSIVWTPDGQYIGTYASGVPRINVWRKTGDNEFTRIYEENSIPNSTNFTSLGFLPAGSNNNILMLVAGNGRTNVKSFLINTTTQTVSNTGDIGTIGTTSQPKFMIFNNYAPTKPV